MIDAIDNVVKATVMIGTTPDGEGPAAIACAPNGKTVYVISANYTGGAVSVIDTATNTITQSIPTGRWSVDAVTSPDGSRLYVSNMADCTISVINTTSNKVIETVPVGQFPGGLTVNHAGSLVYITNTKDDTVSVVSVR